MDMQEKESDNKGKQNRKVKERRSVYHNAVLRLIYLYGCLYESEIANILNITVNQLRHKSGVNFAKLFDDKRYSIHRKNNEDLVKAIDAEDYISFHKLMKVYDAEIETKNIYNSSERYRNLLYGIMLEIYNYVIGDFSDEKDKDISEEYIDCICRGDLKKIIKAVIKNNEEADDVYENAFDNYVIDIVDMNVLRIKSENSHQTERSKNARKSKGSTDAEGREKGSENTFLGSTVRYNIIKELKYMGVLTEGDGELINSLRENCEAAGVDYQSLYELLCYSMHFLHPGLIGYRLSEGIAAIYESLEAANGNELLDANIKYSGFQPQSILEYDKVIDIMTTIEAGDELLAFDYLENEDSILEHLSASEDNRSKREEIMPYRLIYDIRYGRYYMIGLDLAELRAGKEEAVMKRYRLDYMEMLDTKELDIEMIKWIEAMEGKNEEDNKEEYRTKPRIEAAAKYLSIRKQQLYDLSYDGTWISRGTFTDKHYYRRITLRRFFTSDTREPRRADYERYVHCKYGFYNEEEHTYDVIIPNYLDIKPWIMEHLAEDGQGWFGIVGEKRVKLKEAAKTEEITLVLDSWEEVSDDELGDCDNYNERSYLTDNIRETLESMEKYYEV